MAASGLISHRTGDTIERFHDSAKWPETVNHEFAGDVIMEDNVLQGVIIASKSGREAVYAKVAIDATGDGDIAAKAEVTYYKGRREDGSRQPLTLMVNVAGVDTQRAVLPGSFWVATRDHFNFDVHKNTDSGLDKIGLQKRFFQSKGYTIPYGCLLPKGVDSLLLVGGNISGTHLAHSHFRAMPICANIGQAAGVAASLSVKRRVAPRKLTVGDIQAVLLTQGVEP